MEWNNIPKGGQIPESKITVLLGTHSKADNIVDKAEFVVSINDFHESGNGFSIMTARLGLLKAGGGDINKQYFNLAIFTHTIIWVSQFISWA